MTNEIDKEKEILETISCYVSVQDEVLKFFCLLALCQPSLKKDGEDYIHRKYLLGKCRRILEGTPISLDRQTTKLFCKIKMTGILPEESE